MFAEFRFAARALSRWRVGALAAMLTLSIGIGTTTVVYALTRVLVADFPGVPDIDRLSRIYAASPALSVERAPVALSDVDSTLSHFTSFAAIGAYQQETVTIGSGVAERNVTGGYATPAFFTAMGVSPVAGRLFTSADLDAGHPVAIVSDGLWRRDFAGGRLNAATIVLDGVERAIVGVMPRTFSYSFVGVSADVWVPLVRTPAGASAAVTVFARLRPGVAWTAAASELGSRGRAPWTWRAIPIQDDVRRRATTGFAFTLGPALLLLLIGCVNVSCMLMARGIERDAEFSVRRALGATRLHIVRQLFTENALLAAGGGAIGCGLAVAILRVVSSALAAEQPILAEHVAAGFDLLPLALVATMASCVLFGTLPAVRLSRRDIAAALNGVPATYRVHIAGYGARDLVVFFEMGSAVCLVIFAAMIFTLFGELRGATPLFPAEHVVSVDVRSADVRTVREQVLAVPGVTGVTIASGMPGATIVRSRAAKIETDSGAAALVSRIPADASLFDTLGVPVLRGRSFARTEVGAATGVVVLSESAARAIAPNGDALGMRVRISERTTATAIVIGVSGDVMNYGALSRAGLVPPEVYVPYVPPTAGDAVLLVRVPGDPHVVIHAIASAARGPSDVRRPQPRVVSESLEFRDAGAGGVLMSMFQMFSLVALLLAASGVFGVISQSVAQRTQEFGIRMALGAAPRRVFAMVLAREGKLIVAALATGAAITVGLTYSLFAELTPLSIVRPLLWCEVTALCGGLAALALFLATRRILRLAPIVALRRL
jgi:predicted permease